MNKARSVNFRSRLGLLPNDWAAIFMLVVLSGCSYFLFVISAGLLPYFAWTNKGWSCALHSRQWWRLTLLLLTNGSVSLYGYHWARYSLRKLDSPFIRKAFPWLSE
jgi:hypothetical protein